MKMKWKWNNSRFLPWHHGTLIYLKNIHKNENRFLTEFHNEKFWLFFSIWTTLDTLHSFVGYHPGYFISFAMQHLRRLFNFSRVSILDNLEGSFQNKKSSDVFILFIENRVNLELFKNIKLEKKTCCINILRKCIVCAYEIPHITNA